MSTTMGPLCPTLGSVLAEHARIQPEAIALPGSDARYTFAELDARVNQLANALLHRELGIGDLITWLGAPSWKMIETVLAASRLGAQVCHVSDCESPVNLIEMLQRLRPRCVIWLDGDDASRAQHVRRARALSPHRALWIQHDGHGDDGYGWFIEGGSDVACEQPLPADLPLLSVYAPQHPGARSHILSQGQSLLQGLGSLLQGNAQSLLQRAPDGETRVITDDATERPSGTHSTVEPANEAERVSTQLSPNAS